MIRLRFGRTLNSSKLFTMRQGITLCLFEEFRFQNPIQLFIRTRNFHFNVRFCLARLWKDANTVDSVILVQFKPNDGFFFAVRVSMEQTSVNRLLRRAECEVSSGSRPRLLSVVIGETSFLRYGIHSDCCRSS